MKLLLRSPLVCLCLLGCASDPAPLGADGRLSNAAGAPGDLTSTCTDCSETHPDPTGTQTGGEGEQMWCGSAPPRWVVVDETSPIEGTFAGQLRLGGGGEALAQLTITPQGPVTASMYATDAGFHPDCADGRRTEVQWTLHIDGLLALSLTDSLGYALEGSGYLGKVFELPHPQVLATPPTPQDFRDAGDAPAPPPDASTPEQDGTVRLSIYGEFSSSTRLSLQAQWECSDCGTNRVGLAFADGALSKQE